MSYLIDIHLNAIEDFSLDYVYDIELQADETKKIKFTIYENAELVDVSVAELTTALFVMTDTEYTTVKTILNVDFDKTEGEDGVLYMDITTDLDPGEYYGELEFTFDSGIIDKSKKLRMKIERAL